MKTSNINTEIVDCNKESVVTNTFDSTGSDVLDEYANTQEATNFSYLNYDFFHYQTVSK